jgi:hypothetical protein
MKETYKDLMKNLGVGRELTPYESQPWMAYGPEDGITCEAEVRCNCDLTEVEAELQFMYETPPTGKPPVEQICRIVVQQQAKLNNNYTVVEVIIRGTSYINKFYEWEEKSCNFFRACVKEIKLDKIPDNDAILKREMKGSGFFGTNSGDGSNKSPKINTANLMYDMKGKHGRGF